LSGAVGGAVATTANTPFDVVKSRMQNVKKGEEGEWKTVFGTLIKIYKHEGG